MAFLLDDGGTNGANRPMLATFTIDFSNTDYSGGSGAGTPHLKLNNSSSTGQTMINFVINGTYRAKVRADYVGNVTYVANGGSHSFMTGGEVGTGTECFTIKSSGLVNFANATTGTVTGSTATLGGVGTGPSGTAQTGWLKIEVSGTGRWVPYWT